MAKQWMKDYKVNYWKWDGFVDRAQYNAFPSGDGIVGYDVNHQHMYGGPNGYYHVTDMWEKWIHLFDNVWKTASQEKIHKLWISLTCYVNPSPWFLQWSNSIWMQCSHDRNEVSNGLLTDKMNTMLTYRDGAYWEFIKNHNFQFPLSNLYNHDPIYGKEGTGIRADSMTGEQFRNYLYMMGTRGTAFWELYYSDALMNEEKYLVNADYLKWAEKNYRMLRNAKIIGGTPASNVKLDGVRGNLQQEAYGFANFSDDGTEGILSMRNPSTTVKTITFKLGQTIGAKANIAYNKVIDHIYGSKYEAPSLAQHFTAGQDVSVTLQPGETQIWHLYQKQPHHTTTIAYSELQTPRTLRVQMSNHAYDMSFKVYKNGKEITTKSTKSYADLKTFDITLPESASENDVYKIAVVSGKDAAGNQINGDFESTYYEQGVLANVATLNSAHFADVQHSVNGKRGFGITAHVADIKPSTILLAQGKQWALSYTSDSHLRFDVAGATLTSTQPVVKGSNISLVRENNGLIRLYIDGVLDSSAYTIQSAQSDLSHEEITADTHALLTDVTLYNRAINYTEVPKSAIDGLTSHIEAIKDTIDEKSWNENKIDDLLTKAKQAKSADAKERAYKALYAAIAKLIPGEGRTINVARKSTLSCGFVDNDQDASNSGSPLTNAINGMKETPVPYAIFGSDEAKKPAYMTLDLGTTTKLTSVDLWRYWEDGRTYGSTALVVANKADFSDKKVLYYSSANKKIDIFSLGQLPTADLYKETSKGKRLYAATRDMARSVISSEKETIGANVTARYIRLYANGRYLNNQDQGGDNHVVEIEVNGKQQKMPYDISKLKTLIARAGQLIAKGTYTDQTSDMLAQERDKAQQFVTTIEQQLADHVSFNEPLGSIDTYVSSINTAINALAIRTQQSDEHTQDSDQETSVSTNTNDDSIDEASCAITAMYRLYNPWTHEHLFTIDKTEYDRLVAAGWTDEGEIDSVASKNGKAVTRLYNPWTHEHHYASKPEEIAACVTVGWVNEGVKFYSIQNGTIPVYSMYNPYEKKFYHHYTSDEKEIARMERDGWIREDIKWYAAPKK